MPLPIPTLDDRTFQDLIDEMRALIPRFSPDWTDHNLHDPGITFIELFAWLAELEQYRVDQITDESYRRFFKLVGLEPFPLRPARAEITFSPVAGSSMDQGVFLPSRTQVLPRGSEDLVFETVDDIFLTIAKLTAALSVSGSRSTDQTEALQAGSIRFSPFGKEPNPGDALILEFAPWFREPEFHLFFHLYEEDLPPPGSHLRERETVIPSAHLKWEFFDSSEWKSLKVLADDTDHLTRTGRLVFQNPAPEDGNGEKPSLLRCRILEGSYEIAPEFTDIRLNTVAATQVESIVEEYDLLQQVRADRDMGMGNVAPIQALPNQRIRLRKPPLLEQAPGDGLLQSGDIIDWKALLVRLGDPDRIGAAARIWESLDFETRDLIRDLHNNGKDPSPMDRYRITKALNAVLAHAELDTRDAPQSADLVRNRRFFDAAFRDIVIAESLILEVKEEGHWRTWERVQQLEESGPADRHYVLEASSGEVLFGNGLNGRALREDQRVRARFYRHCKGSGGNLPAGLKWSFENPSLRDFRGQNFQPAAGGGDPEGLKEEAPLRARLEFRQRTRAVTAEDYRELALSTPGLRVARAHPILHHDPEFPRLQLPGNITIVVVPARREHPREPLQPPRAPGSGFLRTVDRHLQTHRLLTTRVHVIGPRYRAVSVSARLFLGRRATPESVGQAVQDELTRFFDSLQGGPDGNGWPLGRSVFPSEIYQLLDNLDGIDYVTGISLNGQAPDFELPLRIDELTCAGMHDLEFIRFGEGKGKAGWTGCQER